MNKIVNNLEVQRAEPVSNRQKPFKLIQAAGMEEERATRSKSKPKPKPRFKTHTAVDGYVGDRIKLRRVLLAMSQQRLGELLGISGQLVQKYEKGTDRIGAGRLYMVAKALGVTVGYFYEGADDDAECLDAQHLAILDTPEGVAMAKAFPRIADQTVRQNLVTLAKSLAVPDND